MTVGVSEKPEAGTKLRQSSRQAVDEKENMRPESISASSGGGMERCGALDQAQTFPDLSSLTTLITSLA